MIKAEIITIGDELLIGQVINTNASFLAGELNNIGIPVVRMTSVADTAESITAALDEAASRADLIIGTGGLGPTSDDITKPTLAKYFNSGLVLFPEVLEQVRTLLSLRGIKVKEINTAQAMLPGNCQVLQNTSGTAPGMWFESRKKIYVFLPGVPYEMEQIFREHLKDKLLHTFDLPAIALDSFWNTLSLVFSRPLFKLSFLSFPPNPSKWPGFLEMNCPLTITYRFLLCIILLPPLPMWELQWLLPARMSPWRPQTSP